MALITAPIQTGLHLPHAGFDVPLSTLFLLGAAALALCFSRRRGEDAWITWPQIFFVLAAGLGLIPLLAAGAWKDGVRETFLLAEAVLLTPWLVVRAVRRDGFGWLTDALASAAGALLAINALGLSEIRPLVLSDAKSAILVLSGLPFLLARIQILRRPLRELATLALALAIGTGFGHGGMILIAAALLAAAGFGLRLLPRGLAAAAVFVMLAGSGLQHGGDNGTWAQLNPHYGDANVRRTFIEARAAWQGPRLHLFGGGQGQYRETINELRQYVPLIPNPLDQKVPRNSNCQFLLTMVEDGIPAAVALLALLAWAVVASWRVSRMEDAEHTRMLTLALMAWGAGGLFCVFLSRGTDVWFGALYGMSMAVTSAWSSGGSRRRTVAIPAAIMAASVLASLAFAAVGGRNAFVKSFAVDRPLRIVTLSDDLDTSSRVVKVEATSVTDIVPPFQLTTVSGTVSEKALTIQKNAGKGVGEASATIAVPADGEYRLYGRVWWIDGCSNSLQFVIGSTTAVLTDEVFGRWHVVEARTSLKLTSGPHTVRIVNVEDGIRLDWFALRADESGH